MPTRSNHIVALEVVDFKTIKFHRTEFPERGVVTIQGPNAEGKSAILEALELVTRGKQFGNWPGSTRTGSRPKLTTPVRRGAKESTVKVALRGYELSAVIDEEGNVKARLRNKDGAALDSLSLLKGWINAWSFNADYFRLMVLAGREDVWRDMLLAGAKIEVTQAEAGRAGISVESGPQVITLLQQALDSAYETRRMWNVKVRDLATAVEEIQAPSDAPEKKPDFEKISGAYNKLVADQAAIDRERSRLDSDIMANQREQRAAEALAASYEQKLKDAQARARECEKAVKDAQTRKEGLVFEHTGELAAAANRVKEMSNIAASWETLELKRKKETELLEARAKQTKAEQDVGQRENFLDQLLNRIDLGSRLLRYDGKALMIREGKTLVPFTDANEAKQRIASFELAAGRLGEIGLLVAKGDGLTCESYKELDRIAREKNCLVVLEVATDELRKLGDKDVFLTFEA